MNQREEGRMFGGAAAFLIIALIAAALGYAGVAEMSFHIAWILFLFGLVFAVLFSFSGERESGSGP